MAIQHRACTTDNDDKGSVIFLEKKILLDESYRSGMNADHKSLNKEVVSALLEVQDQFLLVILEPSNDTPTLDDHVHALLLESGIHLFATLQGMGDSLVDQDSTRDCIEQFSQSNGIPAERRYLMHAGLKVTCFPRRTQPVTGTFLSEPLTLSFHTYADMVSWILTHPNAYQNLLNALHSAAELLKQGGLVAFPTETVYGLGADATNPSAVEKIFAAKKRPFFDPLIVHVSNREQMLPLVTELPKKAEMLMDQFWPGPLTIVLPKSSLVPAIVTAGFPSVAIRMPSNPLALELIRLSGKPIAAPSANLFGCTSPTTARHVVEQLQGSYDAIIDGGGCTVGIESTVITFLGETPRILRPGGIDQKAIESCIGKVLSEQQESTDDVSTSPGMLPSHYATATKLLIVEDLCDYASRPDVGVLLFGQSEQVFLGPVEYLSLGSDPSEAAKRLYQAMRRLDSLSLSLLVVKLLPETGIGVAVNNRLMKAAGSPSLGTRKED